MNTKNETWRSMSTFIEWWLLIVSKISGAYLKVKYCTTGTLYIVNVKWFINPKNGNLATYVHFNPGVEKHLQTPYVGSLPMREIL